MSLSFQRLEKTLYYFVIGLQSIEDIELHTCNVSIGFICQPKFDIKALTLKLNIFHVF